MVLFIRVILATLCIVTLNAQDAPPKIETFFSPDGGCTTAIVNTINTSTGSVLVLAYSFTSHEITRALVAAKARGVDVRVILDKSNLTDKHSDLPVLAQNGVPTWIDSQFQIAHDKVMLIDQTITLTGSFNFSYSAEKENAENLLRITDPVTTHTYIQRWGQLCGISQRYQ